MKKILSLVLLLTILASNSLFAQTKLLTIDDPYKNRNVYPNRLRGLQWVYKSDKFSLVENNKLVIGIPGTKSNDTILSIDEINEELAKEDIDTLRRFPAIKWIGNDKFTFINNKQEFQFNISTKELKLLFTYPKDGENIEVEKNTKTIAYSKENNLFVLIDGKETRVTNDKDMGIVNGQTVHRVEFGISKGIFWSPKGNLLAFYRKDETMVADYPLMNIDSRIAEVSNTKYPMAGEKSHHVTMGVYNPATKKTIFLKTGEPADQYLTAITWGPNEKYIYIQVLNREQNHMKLNQYDATTGEFVKTLFEEKNERYVEPEFDLVFLKTKPDHFLFFSERDGYQHLYLFNTDGKLVKQITKGNWVVTDFLGFDPKETKIFFYSTKESPIEQHIYSVDMKSGKITKISSVKGKHTAKISYSGKYIIDSYNNLKVASAVDLLNNRGKKIQTLLEKNDPLKDYNLDISVFPIKGDGGHDLYCRLIKPANFDPSEKYPVLFYVYGGPHSQLVSESWLGGAGYFLSYMSQQGYVVFTMDNRGTANRGFEFESCIHRRLGELEVADQMKGVEYLISLPYVDTDRIGVDGWSYGGFMALSLLLKNPGVFKVAVAGGPVIDWKYYETMYGERYMDTPQENPEGYKNAALINYVDSLEGKVLILHGSIDTTVVPQNSMQFLKTCIEKGKQIDYFVYPGHEHNVRGTDRIHMMKKIEAYFKDNL